MSLINFVHRGCAVEIEIVERTSLWEITANVTPLDGVEVFEPFDTKMLKLPKTEELDLIAKTLVEETRLAIDRRLVGC
ncbi:hypothetical protein PAN31117_04400 [Pandoraea anapnoica]|uniref:Uncharacterized protein n=1 Tax=Pandoraea anapnoica TaxID=2508301 RepID=A0A5E5AFU5_9BURK|nr:hypothetical protein [Pandoraea anapnoica]VVE72469.1 hypothetical protein PAN31117_04400 [Pandoraea anapnoica]